MELFSPVFLIIDSVWYGTGTRVEKKTFFWIHILVLDFANPNQLMSPKYLCRLLFDILPLLIADGGTLAAQHLPRPGGTVQE
jgi:hypothetical protein